MKNFKSKEFSESENVCHQIAKVMLFTKDKTVESISATLFKIIKDVGYYAMRSKKKDVAFASLIAK